MFYDLQIWLLFMRRLRLNIVYRRGLRVRLINKVYEIGILIECFFLQVGHQIIVSYAECMNVPLFRRRIRGSSR